MREHSSSSFRRRRSPSRERDSDRRREKTYKSRKYKKSKKSKKYSRRSSSSSSTTSSYDSRESDYRSSSRRSRTRGQSSESNSRASKTIVTSSENSLASTVPAVKTIDLTDDHVKETLATIEEDKFEVKTFYSTRDREAPKKLDKVVIDLNNETVQIPNPVEIKEITKEQIFHPNFLGDANLKAEKWVRKLYNFRQKHFED